MKNNLTAKSVLRLEFVQNVEEGVGVGVRSKRRGIRLKSF